MRLTTRRLMMLIAVLAVLMGFGLQVERDRRRSHFERAAEAAAKAKTEATGAATTLDKRLHPLNKRLAGWNREVAAYSRRERQRNRRAASRPWPSFWPEDP